MNKQTIKSVKVSATGVQFGNAWFSHESITGYTAEQLNASTCGVTGGAYMAWLSADESEAALAREAALREELASANSDKEAFGQNAIDLRKKIQELQGAISDRIAGRNALQQRLTVAEQLLQRFIDSSVMSFEQDAPEELESLEADICAALKPATEGEGNA